MDVLVAGTTWLALLWGLGFITYPALNRILNNRAVAYALSKTLGLFGFGYIVWVLALCQAISVTPVSTAIILLILVVCLHKLVQRHHGDWSLVPYPDSRDIILIESLFFGGLTITYIFQIFHPEIFWGEKPMDFTFLNFFTRNTVIPPQDPWAAGNVMSYYYFGSLLFGLLHKLTNVPPAVGYGLSVATVAALLVTSLFAACRTVTPTARAALIGAILIFSLGNYDALYLWLTGKNTLNFDLFWATSRTLQSPGINEYPLWTTLFADLHAHFIAFPLFAAVIALTMLLTKRLLSRDAALPHIALLGWAWGTLTVVNSWDYISGGLLIALVLGSLILKPTSSISLKTRLTFAGAGIILLLISVVASLPFHLSVTLGAQIGWGSVYPEEFNTFWRLFRIHGHWLLLALVASFVLLQLPRESASPLRLLFIGAIGLLPMLLGLVHENVLGIAPAPWGVLVFASAFCIAGAVGIVAERESVPLWAPLLVVGGTIVAGMELYYLMDRMNTTFKFNNAVYPILGVGVVGMLSSLLSRSERRVQQVTLAMSGVALVPAIIGAAMAIGIMVTFQRVPGPRPSIDGTAYLAIDNPVEKPAMDWINATIKGTPVLLEAWGPSYREYTRFSMNTGLPTVMGWDHHVSQRGTKNGAQRKADVAMIYTTTNVRAALKLLNRYGVDLIVVGPLERRTYGAEGMRKFDENPSEFPVLFRSGEDANPVTIYTTSYSELRP